MSDRERDQSLPHTRGDEPIRMTDRVLLLLVCPTRVGMNRRRCRGE